MREWAFQFPSILYSLRWSIKYIMIHFTSITKIFLQTTSENYKIEELDENNDLFVYLV